MLPKTPLRALAFFLLALSFSGVFLPRAHGEAMVQYFNTSWREITDKMPELAEAGYNSIWLPPPTKGSGGLSVGYDLWDRFDLGSKDQRGSVSTRYGTEADLLRLVETAHRFGIRIYFDNIMNHNAFDIPGYNADTPIDIYPGLVPEDFHLRLTEDGFYRKWDNTRDWGSAWQVQNLGLADLIDIAQEPGDTNLNFGTSEGANGRKIRFLRNPDNPEYYCFDANGNYVGFGLNNGLTKEYLQAHKDFYSERIEDYLNRTARWLIDRTKADGLRLDAVKHVRADFFGATFGADKDTNDYGYLGQVQRQFNITHGYSDANHRDTLFDTEKGRNDAMLFGEHLGEPPDYGSYVNSGMRLVDNPLRQQFNDKLGNPSNGLNGFDQPGAGGFSPGSAVMHAQSHDSDYAARRELQHAFYFTREGIGLIYTDGNYHAETLGESGGAFPRHANTSFLGQWGDGRVPNLLYIHNQFARGYQIGRWSDSDFIAYERIDKRENTGMTDSDGVTMLIMLNDNYANGQARSFQTSFPATADGSDAYLYNYSTYGGGFYTYASNLQNVVVPPGGYFVFSWRNPEESDLWTGNGGSPITILQNGQPASTLTYERKDGPDGDPAFNPYGVADANASDYKYSFTVPRVTDGKSLSFVARADASAENILLKLDGGVDLNGTRPGGNTDPGFRDNPPAISTDTFLGYEQANFAGRQYGEKFAAVDTTRNKFGSAAAETYTANGGSVTVANGPQNSNGFDTENGNVASFLYHNPSDTVEGAAGNQYNATGTDLVLWGKTNSVGVGYRMFLYYTTDPNVNPEGAGGVGIGATQVVEMFFDHNGSGNSDWWKATISPKPTGLFRYKIGSFKHQSDSNPVASIFPSGPNEVYRKKHGMTSFQVTNFNATDQPVVSGTTTYQPKTIYPHNDYGVTQTGLSEGFHVIRARTFLKRTGPGEPVRASIYNTFTQTFYYDAKNPEGEITFPGEGNSIGGQQYGAVVRTDPSVTEVWYHIDDSDSANDDTAIGAANGNGSGFEPYTDTNRNGQYDTGEAFTDVNGNGVWNANIGESWVRATEVTPSANISSAFQREWRFNYVNIPSGGATATIKVRLREPSSLERTAWFSNPSDSAGHFTTLTRHVATNGPTTRMFVRFPNNDGETIGADYKLKIWFSKSLADNTSTADLISKFLVKIASSESGSAANGVAQGQANYQINYNITNDYHELQYPKNGVSLPNLYNGVPDFLHTVDVTFKKDANSPTLQAQRLVRFAATAAGPFVSINNPPEFDSDGKRFEILLPDVANPTPEQRQYSIQVETDSNAQNVGVVFTSGSGNVALAAATETPLRGLASVTNGSATVTALSRTLTGTLTLTGSSATITGSGTLFQNELSAGDSITVNGSHNFIVSQIASQTSLTATSIYTGATAGGLSGVVNPAFDSALTVSSTVRISGTSYTVDAINSSTSLTLGTAYQGATASGLTLFRADGNPMLIGNHKFWNFIWSNIMPGAFTFRADVDTDGNLATTEASATRNTTVLFRQQVAANPNDVDDDDDGLLDIDESTAQPLPNARATGAKPNPETWTNGDIHIYNAFGKTSPLSPDTDGDGLPDSLEVGWRNPSGGADTATGADTNGDGILNFIGDLDPPFYNTLDNFGRVPTVNSQSEGGDRAKQVAGTTTDPNNSDSDGDGIPDGVEDANHNGWVDGDGEALPTNFDPYSARNWPNRRLDPNEDWTETSPVLADSDSDGLSDGYGEDKNFNGRIDGDKNNNRVYETDEQWTETDPLNADTDGDGLPDGWEVGRGLDPLDNGTLSMRTGALGAGKNGANGNPDGDTIVVNGQTVPYTNALELANGTDPQSPDTGAPPPANSITIGPVPEAQKVLVGGVANYKEFTDWTVDDLIVLDEYEGGGTNNQSGDIYPGYDGFDSSRDLTAFYMHDGGDPGNGGDGNFYFRVDLHDLRPFAEDGSLDIYVVVDTNSPGAGEYKLPDDVDVATEMRWEAVVACYSGNNGRVYVDTNRGTNTTSLANNLSDASFGIVGRDQNTANGFKKAYFNSDLDSVEFSISRQALIDAGWNGIDARQLNFQVITTKDGTGNSPVGAGDIGGRNDVRDTIYDDFLAEDHYNSQSYLSQDANAVLRGWFGVGRPELGEFKANDRGKRAKVIALIHGNQAIQPGSTIQPLINNAAGAGYYRPLDVHEAYQKPVSMHITPTLASAIQWAKVDAASARQYRDGPALNTRIKNLASGKVINLLGSTFSDHILPYFTDAFNADNADLADTFLTGIYGNNAPSTKVLWTPERVLDSATFSKIGNMGFQYTFVDQMRHILKWFGRTSALGDDGYRINEINGIKCLPIAEGASAYLFQNNDNGLPIPLREVLVRKARSGTQDQVIVLFSNWEDFTNKAKADAYDANIRWLANHPWVQIVTPDQIANGQVDLSQPPDGNGDTWGTKDRGTGLSLSKVAHDFIDHATEENYDNWVNGSSLEESLRDKVFNIRSGVPLPKSYGSTSGSPERLFHDAWKTGTGYSSASADPLARATIYASVFETGFHDQANNDLSKFSTGAYQNPDTTFQSLASFAKAAQSQARLAAVYYKVEKWAKAAQSGSYLTAPVAEQLDADLDGENEYLLYNDRVFAMFERIGGRMTGAWVRDIDTNVVHQVVGNFIGYSGSETEEEGNTHIGSASGLQQAYRTSAFKDWFATGAPDATAYVNNLYSVTAAPPGGVGWRFTSSDGRIVKTINLAARATKLDAFYNLSGGITQLYVRFGMSPNLYDLLINGQKNLTTVDDQTNKEISVLDGTGQDTTRAFVKYGGSGLNATYVSSAADRDAGAGFDTVNMRNQAQTQQIEISGGDSMTFSVGFQTGATVSVDSDADGIPDWWTQDNFGHPTGQETDLSRAGDDADGDGRTNLAEYIAGTDPIVRDAIQLQVRLTRNAQDQPVLTFPTALDRVYSIFYRNDLVSGSWTQAGGDITGTGSDVTWTDDGSQTGSSPTTVPRRFYKVQIKLP